MCTTIPLPAALILIDKSQPQNGVSIADDVPSFILNHREPRELLLIDVALDIVFIEAYHLIIALVYNGLHFRDRLPLFRGVYHVKRPMKAHIERLKISWGRRK